jgi:uncharacterized membrane protein
MSWRSGELARTLGGSVFLVLTCLILPIFLFRHVAAVVVGLPGGPLG